jgi:CTP synthase
VITEVGGTVGDIESLPFLEAIRQMRHDVGRDNVFYLHVSLVPYIGPSGELKTKPTQHSVAELRSIGVQPDAIVCRSDRPLPASLKKKISIMCDVDAEGVVSALDTRNIYEIPLVLNAEGLDSYVAKHLGLDAGEPDLTEWQALVKRMSRAEPTVRIGIIGKYVTLTDSYLSVVESVKHGGIAHDARVEVVWIASDDITENHDVLSTLDGILVPGGFGVRGIEGKVAAIRYAREQGVPFLGLCLGLQCAVIEFARDACGLEGANSSEFDATTPHPVIDLMPDQKDILNKGGTMRLGVWACKLEPGSTAHTLYGESVVLERHRHRYEVNNRYRKTMEEQGMRFAGTTIEGRLVEIIEIPSHPFFLATQFHPEFKSRPTRPHPLFRGFVGAALERAARTPRTTQTEHQRTGA